MVEYLPCAGRDALRDHQPQKKDAPPQGRHAGVSRWEVREAGLEVDKLSPPPRLWGSKWPSDSLHSGSGAVYFFRPFAKTKFTRGWLSS